MQIQGHIESFNNLQPPKYDSMNICSVFNRWKPHFYEPALDLHSNGGWNSVRSGKNFFQNHKKAGILAVGGILASLTNPLRFAFCSFNKSHCLPNSPLVPYSQKHFCAKSCLSQRYAPVLAQKIFTKGTTCNSTQAFNFLKYKKSQYHTLGHTLPSSYIFWLH